MIKFFRASGVVVVASLTLIAGLVVAMLPAGAADVTISAGSGDLPITQVVLSTGTQNASQSGVVDAGDAPVTFSSITITDGGPVTLDEFNIGSITTSNFNFPNDLTGVRAWNNASSVEVNTPGFEAAVGGVLSSTDLRDYLAYDGLNQNGSGWNPDFDMTFDAPLRNSDYMLVAERFGNTFFDLVALDKNGDVIPGGDVVGFDAAYRWNTGYAPSSQPTQPMWFTVVDIEAFNVDTEDTPIYGFRIDNDGEADVKFFGLAADPFEPAMSLDKTVYAGHDSGVGCATSGELATVAVNADVTYCFEVTNTGEARLDNLTIDDADLGLTDADDSTLTVVSGSLPLAAGESLVWAYDATAPANLVNTATATADVLLSGGGVNTVLSPETDTDTAEVQVSGPAPASISGKVVDQNGNPIQGVTIDLTGTSSAQATTAPDGTYSFTGLAAGTYTVTETQPAGYDDGPDSIGSEGGNDSVNDEFSNIMLDAGDDSINNDFTEVLVVAPASISGKVVDDNGDPISGVTIDLTGTSSAQATTAPDGTYSFTGLAPGTYTVTETQPLGWGDGPDSIGSEGGDDSVNDEFSNIVLEAGDDSINNDFAEVGSSIAGTVVDQDGVGIVGVTLTLTGTDATGAAIPAGTTVLTNASGDYLFDDLIGGTYTVTETQPTGYDDGADTPGSTGGDASVNDVISAIVLPAGVDSVDNDFAETVIANPASISGTVVDDLGRPIAGVTVTLSGDRSATTTTAADGTYSFTGLPAGTYTVTESQPAGYGDGADTAGPAGGTVTNDRISEIVLVEGQNSVNNDFAETTGSIAGTVVDQDGAGIAGVTVTLTGTDDAGNSVSVTATTDASGDYAFTGLLSGTYTVTESQPAGYDDGADTAGSTGGTVTNDVISEITLGPGVDSVDNDFAEVVSPPAVDPLPDTGSETPLVVAFGLLFIVSGAILTLGASQLVGRRS